MEEGFHRSVEIGYRDVETPVLVDFRFSNERLEDILTDLANWYDVSVIYRDDAAKELHFSGYMQRYDNIKTILDAMTEATGVRFAIQGRDIIVQGK